MLLDNIKNIYTRIARAAMKSERDLAGIRLIAVTKGFGPEIIASAVNCGLREFGESRIQAARQKAVILREKVKDSVLSWHLIGHLQKNKARAAVELFDLIHSVDSLELAEVLNNQAEKIGKIQKILLQVKLSEEESKSGIRKDQIIHVVKLATIMKHLRVEGLMTIPPYSPDPQMARPFFSELRSIRETARSDGYDLKELSMGMSHDFEVAIEEGATMVRVGSALFGERQKEAV